MNEAQQYVKTTTHELARAIQKYMEDNRRSNSVHERWLSDYLQLAWKTTCEVGNCRLSDENSKACTDFRAAELENQIEEKRKEAEKLERELKKVRAA